MAEELDDGEFWLPSQFLTDDDILMDFADYAGVDKKEPHHHLLLGKKDSFDGFELSRLGFGFGPGSTGPNSGLSSPVESVNGSTETESDEDAELLLLSGLTRQMARSTLEDSFNKGSVLSSSPQSTLSTVGRDSVGGGGSSRGSPTGNMSPPKLPPKGENDGALNVLYAAVGEVARMRKMRTEEGTGFFDSSKREALLSGSSVARKPSHIYPVPIATNHPRGFYPPQLISLQQSLQQSQIQQKQMMDHIWGQQKPQLKQQYPQFGQNGREFVDGGRNNSSQSAWPPLQPWNQQRHNQQPQQQRPVPIRPAFLGNPGPKNGPKRESAGTGVFLPRRVGGPNPLRKKPEVPMRCSTGNGNGNGSQRKSKSNRAQAGDTVAAGKTDYGIQLPQEWTY